MTLGYLAPLYDLLDPDRSDLDAYVLMAQEFDARRILDVGCGTGVFALMLAEGGHRRVWTGGFQRWQSTHRVLPSRSSESHARAQVLSQLPDLSCAAALLADCQEQYSPRRSCGLEGQER